MSNLITAVILTYNEEIHIERCIKSLQGVVDDIVVVDSYSTDQTTKLAMNLGARVFSNEWVNYSNQFNWALKNTSIKTDWVWRIDADEYISYAKDYDIRKFLLGLKSEINGVYVRRKIIFLNKALLHGGWYPVWHLKLWKTGKGYCESRWMDEHIKLNSGKTIKMLIDQVDHNLNDLHWWINKHNGYATREMVDLLDSKYSIFSKDEVVSNLFGTSEQRKRWLKLRYVKLPLFIRPFFYFIYRYIFHGGFLDGIQGLIWNFLQGFWYRFLVDSKIYELKKKFNNDKTKIIDYIKLNFTMRM